MKINSNSPAPATSTGKSLRSPVEGAKSLEGPAGTNSAQKKESVGDIANRIADRSGVSATKQRAVQGKGNPNLDKDAFFKLMLTHVKNQDPTSPLKSHEMAAQLAQFSSLEQMSNIKDILGDMNKGQSTSGQYQALNLIGKMVSGDGSKIERAKGDGVHAGSFTLSEPAQSVKIDIKDGAGNVVKSIELQNQQKGNVKFEWDGRDMEGKELAAGSYKVSVDAKSAQETKVPVEMQFKGAVTGIQFTEKGPIVFIGNKQVPLKEIKQIEVQNEEKNAMASMAGLQGSQQAQQALGQMAPSQGKGKFISADQLSPDQKQGLEQAIAALKGGGAQQVNPLTDPTQEVLATAIHNQAMKNQKL